TGLLRERGCALVPGVADADMVILNTCSIREKAEQKFYSELGRLKQLKAERPGMKIAVAGCIAQQEGKNILARAPYVDLIFGPSDVARLPVMVETAFSRRSPVVDTSGDPEYHRKRIPTARVDKVKAWVSIMYGCDNFCTYCVVPYLRGRERSRPSEDIVNEVRELARKGYKEVSLLGQNVNSYGKGLGEDTDFSALLRMVNEVPDLERIRFVTSHPRDLSDSLIDAVRDLPKVCESLHLPVQSGSDDILRAMNRRYTRMDYLDKVKRLQDAVPEITLTTDIIVGFPGENAQDFEATMQLLEEVRFDGIFAFKYSKRPGTEALKLPGHLPEDIKEERLTKVLALQKKITIQKNKAYTGMYTDVLIDGMSKRGGKLSGRTRGNKVVNVAGPDSLIGSLVFVRITAAGVNSLSGEICE
ncbi:MAG TPA: tRNA (N6-isopentenyl adenosine(37)-C2)-methylthiotransferase MiaB, partial [Nitrospirota bacterium]|nr:tRNA (N6-isopentenyl adenosine(37)-C2)-methylthiotransferase MiaB [Nitrospirota bacterium]